MIHQCNKTFARHITLDELTALCVKNKWALDTQKYQQGSDWVTFHWKRGNHVRPVIYSSWNGHFIVRRPDGSFITERSEDGSAPWLDDLLQVLFTNEPRAVATRKRRSRA